MTDLTRVDRLIDELEAAVKALDLRPPSVGDGGEDLPLAHRWRLLALGSSVNDYVFWVRRKAQDDDLDDRPESQMYWAEEVEAGTGAWGVTPREALDRYFRADVMEGGS